jgi:diacylglycerol kinase (ATP)
MAAHAEDAPRARRVSAPRIAIVINPISGSGGRPGVARQRAERAAAMLDARGIDGHIVVTERPGHARELTRALVGQGVATVAAWGGDGTVNEVASALAFTSTTLAIVPSGSGNGLARELGVPLNADGALRLALDGDERTMDAGELDGHLFFNVAGLGLDAKVAHRFTGGTGRRGFSRYLEVTCQELFSYQPTEHLIVTDGVPLRSRALLIAIANSRQYGNGALIAPQARIDDGLLDVVVIDQRSPIKALLQVPRVFLGQVGRVKGVSMRTAAVIEISSDAPTVFHVDGEPYVGGATVTARVHPAALRVKVPRR